MIVGGDGVSYGPPPPRNESWKSVYFDEVASLLDPSRVHFLPHLPYEQYVRLLQVSRIHVYLTFPFVLSWSLIEAMTLGCVIVGSDTAPVREVITDDVNGLLTPFHDPGALADKVARVLADPGAFAHLGRAARATAIDRYARTACVAEMMQRLDLVDRKGAADLASSLLKVV